MADELPWWVNLSVRLAKAVPGLAGLAASAAEQHRLSNLVHDLALLAFWQDGVLAPLRRMSTRGSTVEDISEIAAWQKRTAEEVANASNGNIGLDVPDKGIIYFLQGDSRCLDPFSTNPASATSQPPTLT
jgi:hypothetical protein